MRALVVVAEFLAWCFAIWLFIGEHFERFLCTLKCYRTYYDSDYRRKTQYVLADDGLIKKGVFGEDQSSYKHLLWLAGQSEALTFFNVPFPINYSAEQINTIARSFSEIAKEIKKSHKLTKFYVLFYQNFPQQAELITALKYEGISIITFNDIPWPKVKDLYIPGDGHPTSNFYWLLTELLKPYFNP